MTLNNRLIHLGLVLALLVRTTCCEAFKAMGYYFIDESLPSLQQEIYRLDEVMFDSYGIDSSGNVHGAAPKNGVATARTNNKTKVFMTVSNFGVNDFDGPRVHAVLKMPSKVRRLINNLVRIAQNQKFDGVNIDFEAIPRRDRARFTSFIKQLSSRLHALSLQLAISLPAIEEDNPMDGYSGAFDYKTLGEYADIMQVMTYDEHGPWDMNNIGPVSGLDWLQRCINYTLTVVPAEKISVGIPAYGYVYNLKKQTGYTIAWKDFPTVTTNRTVHWDYATSSPYVQWTDSKTVANMVAWIENVESIALKAKYVRSIPNIHGVSVWALAHENTLFWNTLLNTV